MSGLKLFWLGPPRIERDGVLVDVERRKAIALLAYLAVAGGPHSRDTLATLFWPEADQARARGALRRDLSVLNRALGPEWLEVEGQTVGLRRSAGLWMDVDEFRDRLAVSGTHGHPETDVCPNCITALTDAVTLCRDDFLAGFTLRDSPGFDEWQLLQTEGLRRELIGALERLVQWHSAREEHEPAITHARRWSSLDPLHEPAHRHLMLLYSRSGQRSAALHQYRECARILDEELGLPPSEETTQLHEAIKTGEAPVAPSPARPPRRHNLPAQPTPFIGREEELALIAQRIENPDCRLLTVVGPGGAGKSRLALEAAAERIDDFPHGVYFVALAPIHSPDILISAIADALAFTFSGDADPKVQLLNYLREKQILLVLDNFEHLLAEPGTRLLMEILDRASGAKLLVTSRERLNLQGEWLLPLAGLRFPEEHQIAGEVGAYSAVQLFVQCAEKVQPGFSPFGEERSSVVHICQLVEGMPLGVELAAAWTRVLPCGEIAREIAKNLDFLATSMPDVPARHRSLRAAFEQSWRLLSDEEQRVFGQLSVFRGGFRRQAAEKAAGASLVLLAALRDKSLLRAQPSGRYEVHEVLRQYAEEKLEGLSGESEKVHDLHCEYYAAFAQQAEALGNRGRLREAIEEIGGEIENVRAAWRWAIAHGKLEAIGRLGAYLYLFYEARSLFGEGMEAFGTAVAKVRGMEPGREAGIILGQALAAQAWFCFRAGGFGKAKSLAQEGVTLLRSLGARSELALPLVIQGAITAVIGPHIEAKPPLHESIAIAKETGNQVVVGSALFAFGIASNALGQYAEAQQHLRQGLAVFKAVGHQWGIGFCLQFLGDAARALDQYAEATQCYQEGVAVRAEIGDRWGMAACLSRLGQVARVQGRYDEARTRYQESLAIFNEMNHPPGVAACLGNLGSIAIMQGAYAEAQRLLQDSLAISREIGDQRGVAISLNHLGHTALALRDTPAARSHFREALKTALEVQAVPTALEIVVGLAELLIQEREDEQAIELLALALHHPVTKRQAKDRAGHLLTELAPRLPSSAVVAAQERGRARNLEQVVEKLLE